MSKEAYIDFVKNDLDHIPIFYQPWWIELVSEGRDWDVAMVRGKNDDVLGIWPYVVHKKYGFRLLILPILTPHLGPYLFYPKGQNKEEKQRSFEKKVISQLIDQLPAKTHVVKIKSDPKLTNWQPLYWRGFRQTTHYTYQLDLSKFDESGYTSSLRADIKKVPDNIEIEKSDDIELLYKLAQSSFTLQKSVMPYSLNYLQQIDNRLQKLNAREILIARRRDDNAVVGGVYIIYSNQTAYLPIIGRGDTSKTEGGVTKKLINQSILTAKSKGLDIYDFEGSMFPQFEKVFRSFGSKQTPYHVLSRINNPFLKYYFDK